MNDSLATLTQKGKNNMGNISTTTDTNGGALTEEACETPVESGADLLIEGILRLPQRTSVVA